MTTSTFHHSFAAGRSSAISTTYWLLRAGAALCFIGHGAFGFITKSGWLPYFAVVGIPESWAWAMMPLVGAVDVLAAFAVLFAPRGLPLVYMVVWAAWTALLRPLAGESIWQAVERAGNYGVPLALLVLTGFPRSWRDLMATREQVRVDAETTQRVFSILRWTTVMLLLGHGAIAFTPVSSQPELYATAGLPNTSLAWIGAFEIALAIVVAARPAISILVFVAFWKVTTELLWVAAGHPIWEFVERAGSYTAPLALATLMVWRSRVLASR